MKRTSIIKVISLFLLAAFLLPSFSACSLFGASNDEDEPFYLIANVEGGVELVTVSDQTIEEIVIPTEIDGKPVVSIGTEAFANFQYLRRVVVPSTVKSIGNGAFYNCNSLEVIELEETIGWKMISSEESSIISSSYIQAHMKNYLVVSTSVRYEKTSGKNVGIVDFSYKTSLSGVHFEVTIKNDSADDENVFITLEAGDVISTQSIYIGGEGCKKIVFTSKTGHVSDSNTDYYIINSISSFETAKITIHDEDVILSDNEASVTYVPPKTYKILYVSDNFTLKNGEVDLVKQTPLLLALIANGCEVLPSDLYHSSAVNRAPNSGYDIYIYEGTQPDTLPTDGSIWLLDASESPSEFDFNIGMEKDAFAENSVQGYQIEDANDISVNQNNLRYEITKKTRFEHIKTPNGNIGLVTSKYKILGTLIWFEDEYGNKTLYSDMSLPSGFEPIYDAVHYESINNEIKEIKTPIMVAGKVDGKTIILTTFDFSDTSFPIFVTDFPILIKNMVEIS